MVIGIHHKDATHQKLSSIEHSFSGFTSGFLTRIVIQPLDVLKIRLQLQEEPIKQKGVGKYRGLIHTISVIYREEGIRAFWKGHIPAQGLSAIYGFVQFSAYEFLSKEFHFAFPNTSRMVVDFAGGAIAGTMATTASMPLDVVRTRLVAQGIETKTYRGSLHAFRKIWRVEGFSGFFRGLTPSLYQIFPYTGFQFMFYNFINRFWRDTIEKQNMFIGSFGTMSSGFLAGVMAKTIVYPLDLVRHRFQVNALIRGKQFGRTTAYKGVFNAIITVIQTESFFGLFKGLSPSLLKTGSSSALTFFFYELICDLLRSGHTTLNQV